MADLILSAYLEFSEASMWVQKDQLHVSDKFMLIMSFNFNVSQLSVIWEDKSCSI